MKKKQLVEIHQFKNTHKDYKELDNLCLLSKKLYNSTMYTVRQEYINSKTYLDYYKVNKKFTIENQVDYRCLPAKVSKHTQQLVHKSFLSFFKLLKLKNSKNYDNKISLPSYLDKNGRQIVHYEKGALSFTEPGFIKLSKTNIKLKTSLLKDNIQFVRIVPRGNHIKIEIGYKKEIPELKTGYNYASVDPGLNNLLTVTSNVFEPFIINGKPIKSINQYYNKKRAKFYTKNSNEYSNFLDRLSLKRENKLNDYIHKSTNKLVNHLVSHNINTLIIGQNPGWKQEINIGKRNNQNFVGIPFYKIIEQLKYKCELVGIECVVIEENYTSKCSFFDNEVVGKHDVYLGKRVKRGLFKLSDGVIVNADVNGSLNILRKYLVSKGLWSNTVWSSLVSMNKHKTVSKWNPVY